MDTATVRYGAASSEPGGGGGDGGGGGGAAADAPNNITVHEPSWALTRDRLSPSSTRWLPGADSTRRPHASA